jgi:hypothetical protein
VTPVRVAPGQANAIPLPPEFVQPQDGKDKQNCELVASARWLARWGEHYRPWRITYLGDDLYCHQSHGLRVRAQQADFLFTCQPESHATLYEWVGDFERNAPLGRVVQARRVGQKPLTDTYRDAHQVPLRNTDDAVMANWLERVTTNARGAIVFKNAWAPSHAITDHHVAALASAGRARWEIDRCHRSVGSPLTQWLRYWHRARATPLLQIKVNGLGRSTASALHKWVNFRFLSRNAK